MTQQMCDRQTASVDGGDEKEPGRDTGTTTGKITATEEMGNVSFAKTGEKKIASQFHNKLERNGN